VARLLRRSQRERPAIIMLSAVTLEKERLLEPDRAFDDYMIKPLDLRQLLEKFHTLLNVQWITSEVPRAASALDAAASDAIDATASDAGKGPSLHDIEALIGLGQIGHVRGINAKLAEIESSTPEHAAFVKDLRVIVETFNLSRFLTVLEAERSRHAR
jgi:hypothetical protein